MIRSEHVLLCHEFDGPHMADGSLGVIRICGFDGSREVAGQVVSRDQYDGEWTYELYCHSDRQQKTMAGSRQHPKDVTRFKSKHDVYNLGVVLLELGLWKDLESFVTIWKPGQPLLMNIEPKPRREKLHDLADLLPPKIGSTYGGLGIEAIGIDEHQLAATQVWSELEGLRI